MGCVDRSALSYLQAELKAVARVQRFEALLHRLVTLELALHHVAMSKYSRCWELLVQVTISDRLARLPEPALPCLILPRPALPRTTPTTRCAQVWTIPLHCSADAQAHPAAQGKAAG